MNIQLIIPKIVQGYIARLPEVRNNAYNYFNYDNRVVDESVNRGDIKRQYQGPFDFTDAEYDSLVNYAKTILDPILLKYSIQVAAEDALHMAIRDYGKGLFDSKINANKFNVLRSSLMQKIVNPNMGIGVGVGVAAPPVVTETPNNLGIGVSTPSLNISVMGKKKKEKKNTDEVSVPQSVIRSLGLKTKDIPVKEMVRMVHKNTPHLYRTRGKTVLKKSK